MGPAARANMYRPTGSLRKVIESRCREATVPNEFVHTVEKALNQYCQRALHALVTVSKHRAAESLREDNMDLEGVSTMRNMNLENWLLFKEDCATYFGKVVAAAASESAANTSKNSEQTNTSAAVAPKPNAANIIRPVFSESDYSVHALEEEAKLLLTAKSVRQVSLRDMLPLILSDSEAIACPSQVKQKLVNKITFGEVCADYRARGYANALIPTTSVD